MRCKIFYGSNRQELEDMVNKWLETNPVTPDSMRFEFSTASVEDETSYKLEHTLVLFYVPMQRIR